MFHYRQVRINLYLNLVCFAVKNFIGNIFRYFRKIHSDTPPLFGGWATRASAAGLVARAARASGAVTEQAASKVKPLFLAVCTEKFYISY